MKAMTRLVRYTLLVLAGFSAVSALGGGMAILVTGGVGMGMPLSMLDGSPFSTFTMPALVLFVVVGGTQVAAFVALLRHHATALAWSAVAGFGLTIWIVVETVIIRGFSALQAIYLVCGIAELALVMALLGIVPWIPRLTNEAPPKRDFVVSET
jgi:hypothetical protein